MRLPVELEVDHGAVRAIDPQIEIARRLPLQGDGDRPDRAAGLRHRLVEPGDPALLLPRAALRLLPAIICGKATLSSAVNSGSRWWNW